MLTAGTLEVCLSGGVPQPGVDSMFIASGSNNRGRRRHYATCHLHRIPDGRQHRHRHESGSKSSSDCASARIGRIAALGPRI